jgi:hypothetical protein
MIMKLAAACVALASAGLTTTSLPGPAQPSETAALQQSIVVEAQKVDVVAFAEAHGLNVETERFGTCTLVQAYPQINVCIYDCDGTACLADCDGPITCPM